MSTIETATGDTEEMKTDAPEETVTDEQGDEDILKCCSCGILLVHPDDAKDGDEVALFQNPRNQDPTEAYCEEHYAETFFECNECGEVERVDDSNSYPEDEDGDGEMICSDCFTQLSDSDDEEDDDAGD